VIDQGVRSLAVLQFGKFVVREGGGHIDLIDWLSASHVGQINRGSVYDHVARLRKSFSGYETQ
jgi:hypothetical protein